MKYALEKTMKLCKRSNGSTLACSCSLRVLLLVVLSSLCHAGDLVLFSGQKADQVNERQIRTAANFYGLTIEVVDSRSLADVSRVIWQLRGTDRRAVLVSGDALEAVDRKRLVEALWRPHGKSIPLLVFGIRHQNASALKVWSGRIAYACDQNETLSSSGILQVEKVDQLVGALAGVQLPLVASPSCAMRVHAVGGTQTVLSAREGSRTVIPVLLRNRDESSDVFFAPQMDEFDSSWVGNPLGLAKAFSSVAQYMLFLRYAAGDYGWHAESHYANLTVDDVWLREPYGHFGFQRLLDEMERHNFHTTLAFIPWNFDRSDPNVAALVRDRSDRFSICIHGNNHSHREFGDYSNTPLEEQIRNIKQSVARMERFRSLTGIPYDRFMVFPHAVSPTETFAALKRYDFLGTANSVNVPAGVAFPQYAEFLLRPYTLKYSEFLSFFRYSAEGHIQRTEIAIHAFLGNPLLFYGHQELFAKGIGAFNEFADVVNRVQPGTQWSGLAEISRHLYLIRRRTDSGFDVQMLSNEMSLQNNLEDDAKFYIQREENQEAPIRALLIDDSAIRFERSGENLIFSVVIPAKQVKRIRILYSNDLELRPESFRKDSIHAAFLRHVSDFRDLYLSQTGLGRMFISRYYGNNWDSLELKFEKLWWQLAGFVGVTIGVGVWYRRYRLRRSGRGN